MATFLSLMDTMEKMRVRTSTAEVGLVRLRTQVLLRFKLAFRSKSPSLTSRSTPSRATAPPSISPPTASNVATALATRKLAAKAAAASSTNATTEEDIHTEGAKDLAWNRVAAQAPAAAPSIMQPEKVSPQCQSRLRRAMPASNLESCPRAASSSSSTRRCELSGCSMSRISAANCAGGGSSSWVGASSWARRGGGGSRRMLAAGAGGAAVSKPPASRAPAPQRVAAAPTNGVGAGASAAARASSNSMGMGSSPKVAAPSGATAAANDTLRLPGTPRPGAAAVTAHTAAARRGAPRARRGSWGLMSEALAAFTSGRGRAGG
mmetsp:Transcript_28086/g.77296  ORF Transcript_28086/g.77296 Transcript_28086/m.77296 type:complete len:321 (+) Transcript_28086:899-1861(+)